MPRYRQPFSLFSRKTKFGKKIWYYRTYDEYGQRTNGISTGCESKTRAHQYCMKLYRDDLLVPSADPFFRIFAENWWIWDICPYVKKKAHNEKISQRYAYDQRRILEDHLLPHFGKYHLSSITPMLIEKFIYVRLIENKKLSPKRANNIVATLRSMLNEARRHGMLRADPFAMVELPKSSKYRRKLLTLEKVRDLFTVANIATAWNGHYLYRVINMVAASTGMRQGEILAVRDEDVRNGYIHVAHSWSLRYGLGPTKNKAKRDVPVPRIVMEAIKPFRGTGGFVFSIDRGRRPATGNRATEALYAALEAIGIPRNEQKQRNITFHAWRAWFNTIVQQRHVPAPLIRAVVGHKTPEMTDLYSHFSLEHFAPIVKAQEELFHGVAAVQGEIFTDEV